MVLNQRQKTLLILWVAFIITVPVYLVVTLVIERPNEPVETPIFAAFGFMALATFVASLIVPGRLHQAGLRARELRVIEAADPGASDILPYRDAPKRRVFADSKAAERAAHLAFMQPFIISLAMAEVLATLGLSIGFLGATFTMQLPFLALAWLRMFLAFPSESKTLGPLEKAFDAKLVRA